MRSARHQENLEVSKGGARVQAVAEARAQNGHGMQLMLIPTASRAACFVPAGIPARSPQRLSRHPPPLLFLGWRNARNGAGPNGAVRRLAPSHLNCTAPGATHLRRGESEALPPGGAGESGGLRLKTIRSCWHRTRIPTSLCRGALESSPHCLVQNSESILVLRLCR